MLSRKKSLAQWLVPLAVLIGAIVFYAPFFCRACIVTADLDAFAILGHLRATNDGIGWPVGFYIHSIFASGIAGVLERAGIARVDYALGYQGMIYLALISMTMGVYYIVVRTTASELAAILSALAVGLTPGMVRLVYGVEDNLLAAALQLQYLGIYIWYVRRMQREESNSRFGFAELLFAVSLWLAVNAHHQANVLWVTPLALFYFLRHRFARRERFLRVAGIYCVSLILFALFYVFLTYRWFGEVRPGAYVRRMASWFVPNSFCRGYYFFNRAGWNLPAHLDEIGQGASQLVRVENSFDPLVYAGLLTVFILLAHPFFKHVRAYAPLAIAAMFVVVNVPHSLIYESYSLERWDAIIVPLILAIAMTTVLAWRDTLSKNTSRYPVWIVTALITLLLSANAVFYLTTVQRLQRTANAHDWLALQAVLLRQVEPSGNTAPRRVLLLTEQEFDWYVRRSQLYFNHERDLYSITPDGSVFHALSLYQDKTPVTVEQFRADTRDAEFVYSPFSAAFIQKFLASHP